MKSKKITLSILSLICFTSVLAQAETLNPEINRPNVQAPQANRKAPVAGIHQEQQFNVTESRAIREGDQVTIQASANRSMSFKTPKIEAQTDKMITVTINGTEKTPEGLRDFSQVSTTTWADADRSGIRSAELVNSSSLSGETFTNKATFFPATKTEPAHISFKDASGLEFDFVKDQADAWRISSTEGSRWGVTPVDANNFMVTDGTKTKKIHIEGRGANAVFYISGSSGSTYAISGNSLIPR